MISTKKIKAKEIQPSIKDPRSKFFNFNLYSTFFLAFSGYYIILMFVANFGSPSLSRYFTIPVRIILLLGIFFLYRASFQRITSKGYLAFLIFSALYLLRIFWEMIFGLSDYYLPNSEFLLYFLGFVLIPFAMLSRTNFRESDYQKAFHAILISCIILSVQTYIFYGNLIGQVARISQEIKHDENYISPLALSYCAALGIGIGGAYLLTNKTQTKKTIWIWGVMFSCLIPFFLGASRGSVFALAIPFLIYFIYTKGVKRRIQLLLGTGIGIALLIYSTSYLGTGVFDRFFGIEEAIESGSSSAMRLDIWKADFNQFLDHPIFGNSLESEFAGHYPHNIIIETLITTGIIGFIPFFLFLYFTFKKVILIIKKRPKYFWITVIFIQAIVQYMFSGAIWGASWVAIGAALTLGFSHKERYLT